VKTTAINAKAVCWIFLLIYAINRLIDPPDLCKNSIAYSPKKL
jgi:hypothetical protein